MTMKAGEVYGIFGRLCEVADNGHGGLLLVALDGNGRPYRPPLAFDLVRDDAAIVVTAQGATPVAVGVVALPLDRLELVADSRRLLFAPLSKDLAAILDR